MVDHQGLPAASLKLAADPSRRPIPQAGFERSLFDSSLGCLTTVAPFGFSPLMHYLRIKKYIHKSGCLFLLVDHQVLEQNVWGQELREMEGLRTVQLRTHSKSTQKISLYFCANMIYNISTKVGDVE